MRGCGQAIHLNEVEPPELCERVNHTPAEIGSVAPAAPTLAEGEAESQQLGLQWAERRVAEG